MRRQQQTVEHVEALAIVLAFGPRHDVAGTQQGAVGDTGQWAAPIPVVIERGAESALADAQADLRLACGRAGGVEVMGIRA